MLVEVALIDTAVAGVVVVVYGVQSGTAHKHGVSLNLFSAEKWKINLGETKQRVIWTEQSHTELFTAFSPVLHNHFRDSLILKGGIMIDGTVIEHI